MNGRLLVVVGPSGAGKDSLLAWLREHMPASQPVHWVRRTITRPAQAGGEAHEGLSEAEFETVLQTGGFALHWHANGLRYGIRHEELKPLQHRQWIFLNGSRAHLDACALAYPGMTVLHITADVRVLRERLRGRGREDEAAMEARLLRAVDLVVPRGSRLIEVHNSCSLDQAGQQLLQALQSIPGWPVQHPTPGASLD